MAAPDELGDDRQDRVEVAVGRDAQDDDASQVGSGSNSGGDAGVCRDEQPEGKHEKQGEREGFEHDGQRGDERNRSSGFGLGRLFNSVKF
jgi:hypothetical protein